MGLNANSKAFFFADCCVAIATERICASVCFLGNVQNHFEV